MDDADDDVHEWEETRWWRVISLTDECRIWCETPKEKEARAALDNCPYPARLERLFECQSQQWVEENT
jgi:hypothetical protein